MSDSYQAIYDAVRSRISSCSVSDAVQDAVAGAFSNAGHLMLCLKHDYEIAANEMQRPCVLFRPAIFLDGNEWCALYGANLQDGVAGFGESPYKAMQEFDAAWYAKRVQVAV